METQVRSAIEQMAFDAHKPELAEEDPGHVIVLFDDGEIVSTKCGPLLWCRTLHHVRYGLGISFGKFPVERDGRTLCFSTEEEAVRIRDAMLEWYPAIKGCPPPTDGELHQAEARGWLEHVLSTTKDKKARKLLKELLNS